LEAVAGWLPLLHPSNQATRSMWVKGTMHRSAEYA